MLKGKSILLTGGTGSFGKKFIETVLLKYPEIERLVVFSRDEFKQFEMAHQFPQSQYPQLRFFIGDVRDVERLHRALDSIDFVVHAAALKHVPGCEYNPFEAVKTNIFGAQNIITASIDRNVKRVIALSTDKACAPINLYGATKLCSDKLFIAGNAYAGQHETRFAVVRYGNVLGSRGSVVPFFRELIRKGAKELPITHADMTRFWISVEEGVELVLTAFQSMLGGEMYVPKIPSMRVVDLANAMAPHLPTKVIGMRPGEKLHETLICGEDAKHTLEFSKHFVVQPAFDWWDGQRQHKDGRPVPEGFKYRSDKNNDWISIEQMREILRKFA